jgi:hypothetical protein
MFRWWQRLQDRERHAEEDAAILIARFGTRASYIASRRVAQMRAVCDSNRPPCHWKRVHSLVRQLLPYDGDDGGPDAATNQPEKYFATAAKIEPNVPLVSSYRSVAPMT